MSRLEMATGQWALIPNSPTGIHPLDDGMEKFLLSRELNEKISSLTGKRDRLIVAGTVKLVRDDIFIR